MILRIDAEAETDAAVFIWRKQFVFRNLETGKKITFSLQERDLQPKGAQITIFPITVRNQ